MKKMRTCLIAAAVGVALVMASGLLFFNGAVAQDKAKGNVAAVWEYKVIRMTPSDNGMEKALNDLGKDSWECVSTVSDISGGNFNQANRTSAVVIFKRSKK